MHEQPPDVMTFEEVMAYLRIPRSSLYKLAQEGKIPSQKVGRHWRFRRRAIDRWLEGIPVKQLGEDGRYTN
jgi:excisionase family DNA binding protein